jgi:UDP-N-acetyl-D-mannosaminuronic acid dehydrogenase
VQKKAEEIFKRLTGDIMHTTFVSAELVKLFNNISRYIHFAVSNQFSIIADNFGQNIYEIIEMANYKYPRGIIAKPGFTAGTCLRKDFGMINETIPYTDLLLSAWKINEFMPKFMVDNLQKRVAIYNKNVAVLGYSFKNDTDDTRDSLTPKLIRYIKREMPLEVRIHDPYLPKEIDCRYKNYSLDDDENDGRGNY